MTFKKQLMVILFMFAVIPTLVVGLAGIIVAVRRAEAVMDEGLSALVVTSGESLNSQVMAQKNEISLIAANIAIVEYLKTRSHESTRNVDNLLESWVHPDTDYDDAVITDKNGVIVRGYSKDNIGRDISGEYYIKKALDGDEPYISNATDSILNPGKTVIAVSRRVTDENGDVVGVVVVYVGSGFFEGFLEKISIGKNGFAFLTDANGDIIYHPENRLLSFSGVARPLYNVIRDYARGTVEKTGFFTSKFSGASNFMYYYILDDISWVLILRLPSNEFQAARYIIMVAMAIVFFVCVVVSLILGHYLAMRVTKPINELAYAFSNACENGEYQPCHVSGGSEFVELAENYNAMTARINSYNSVLEDIAYHDPLTGLGNWFAIENKLAGFLELEKTGGVICLDLDDFRYINDLHGRDFGNEALQELSRRISSDEFGFEICARTGGDEFYLLKEGTREDVTKTVSSLIKTINEPITINQVVFDMTASIGVKMFPEDGDTFGSICKNAEIAMYKAKSSEKNCFCFFDLEMSKSIERHNAILEALKICIDTNSLFLVYQPEVDPKTGKICAFEALMRVKDPELGFLSPGEFIPIAESSGLVIQLGAWALETACRFAKQFYDANEAFDNISVNVSTLQLLENGYVESVIKTLEKTGLPPHFLQLEITESTLIRNMKDTLRKLTSLRELGVKIAMDDFGTSYSSFNYLTSLPIDTLKIDKSFIDDIVTDKKRETITKTIINMAHEMHLAVVAEGIEDKDQLSILKAQDCDIIQGYFYSKPLPMPEALKLMEDGGIILK